MPLPVSDLLSLAEAVRFVVDATHEAEARVRQALVKGLSGDITATGQCRLSSAYQIDPARYWTHPAFDKRQPVPAEQWNLPIDWQRSRIGPCDVVWLKRAEIGQWLGSVGTKPALGTVRGPEATGAGARRAEQYSSRKQTIAMAGRAYIAATYPNGLGRED